MALPVLGNKINAADHQFSSAAEIITGTEAAKAIAPDQLFLAGYRATQAAQTPQTVTSAFTDAHGFPDFLYNGQEDFAPMKVPTGDAISGGDYAGGYYAYQAFDGSDSTRWASSQIDSAVNGVSYIGLKNLKRNIKAIKYLNNTLVSAQTSIKVDYSTDGGVTWTNIQTTTVVATASTWNEFVVATYAAGDAGLHAIRLLANSNCSGGNGWSVFSLILLYNSNLDVCTTTNAVSYDEFSGSYINDYAFDNKTTVNQYQSLTNMSTGNLYIGQSGLAAAVKAVRFCTYSNATYNAKEVRLSWKQNVGDAWTDLATVALDTTGVIWQTISVPPYSPAGSHYFALRPTTNCGASQWCINEMEFYCGDDTDISMIASATDPLQLVHSSGQTNYLTEVTASDTTLLGSSMVAGKTHFIYADRNPSTGAITYGAKPVCPQYGQEFDSTKHCLLHFEGADASTVITDEYGSAWTVNGNAQIDNNATPGPKFGSTYLRLDGTGDSIKNTNRYWFNGQPFTIEGWWFTANHLTASQSICSVSLASPYPIHFEYNAHDSIRLYLSSNGSSWDIISGTTYIFTAADNTYYKFIIEWDGYCYRVWWGTSTATMVLAMNIKSSTPLYTATAGLEFGGYNSGTGSTNGGMDEIRITLGSNRYGWSPVAEVAAFDKYDSDMTYFDINKMKMYYGGGTSWTEVQRLFLGEAYMDAHGVTDMRNYALKGRYESFIIATPAASTKTVFNHNLGSECYEAEHYMRCKIAEQGYYPGEKVWDILSGSYPYTKSGNRKILNFSSMTGIVSAAPKAGGAIASFTLANWETGVNVKRRW